MFGISLAEFLVVLVIAVAVIPAKHWGDVAKFLARAIKFVRDLIWKITDGVNDIRDQIDLEKPIDDIASGAIGDIKSAFATPIGKSGGRNQKPVIKKTSKAAKSSVKRTSVVSKNDKNRRVKGVKK